MAGTPPSLPRLLSRATAGDESAASAIPGFPCPRAGQSAFALASSKTAGPCRLDPSWPIKYNEVLP